MYLTTKQAFCFLLSFSPSSDRHSHSASSMMGWGAKTKPVSVCLVLGEREKHTGQCTRKLAG